MQVTIRFFATLRELAGIDRARIDLPEPATLGTLMEQIRTDYPALEPMLATTIVAVNNEYASVDSALSEGDEVGLFPPISGGAPGEITPHL